MLHGAFIVFSLLSENVFTNAKMQSLAKSQRRKS